MIVAYAMLIASLGADFRAGVTGLSPSVPAIDFGDVPRDAQRSRSIELVNRGPTAIELGRPDADCICLSGTLPVRNLAPGARTTWQIQLSTCDYIGEVRRQVWLEQNGLRVCTIPVHYRVVPELYAEPSFASVGWVRDAPGETTLEIRSSGGTARLLDATSSTEGVTAIIERDSVTPETPGQIRLTVSPALVADAIQATLFIHTDSVEVPTIRIPVHGEADSPVIADRTAADFGAVAERTKQSLDLRLQGTAEIRSIRASGDAIEIADVARQPDGTRVRLRMRADQPIGMFQGFVSVDTVEDGRSRTLRLPYLGRVVESDCSTARAAATNPRCCHE